MSQHLITQRENAMDRVEAAIDAAWPERKVMTPILNVSSCAATGPARPVAMAMAPKVPVTLFILNIIFSSQEECIEYF